MKAFLFDSFLSGYVVTLLYVAGTNPKSDDLLGNLNTYLVLFLVAAILGGILSKILVKNNIKTLGEAIFQPPHKRKAEQPKAWLKTFWGMQLAISFILSFGAAIVVTEFSMYELFSEQGFQGAGRVFAALFNPELSVIPSGILAIVETIYIAFMATVIAIPLAFVLSFFCAKNLMGKTKTGTAIYFAIRTFLNVTRSIEPLVWAIIFSIWVGIGPFAGMLALMLHSIASLAKQYSEIIECVDEGPIEGIRATGANTLQVVWFAIVPQIVLPNLSYTIYRWDINVRMATVLGLVGAGGIGTMLNQYQGQALWNEVGALVLLIVIVVWVMDTASAYIREAIK